MGRRLGDDKPEDYCDWCLCSFEKLRGSGIGNWYGNRPASAGLRISVDLTTDSGRVLEESIPNQQTGREK